MEKGQHWGFDQLVEALRASEEARDGRLVVRTRAEIGPDAPENAMLVILPDLGDMPVVVVVARPVIRANVVVAPAGRIGDRAEFERGLLRANRTLSLSAFALTSVAGEECYEIFGQLSTGSEIEEIIEEIETLGRNALDAAELVAEWSAGKTGSQDKTSPRQEVSP